MALWNQFFTLETDTVIVSFDALEGGAEPLQSERSSGDIFRGLHLIH